MNYSVETVFAHLNNLMVLPDGKEFRRKYNGIDDVDAINMAEKFERRLGSNYMDLRQF